MRGTLPAALLFAAAVVGYLSPALFGGDVLSASGKLYDFVPWHANTPPDLSKYHNRLLADAAVDFDPWRRFARQALWRGELPAWNPHVLSGTPFFANAQTALLSPFNVPYWVLDVDYAAGVSAALKLWVAGFGTYLLARELRLSFFPGVLAGLSFAFCAFNIDWLSHPHTNVSVMLPLALWATERILTRGRGADGLLLAACAGVAFLGGHPGTQVHLVVATVTYAVVGAAVSTRLRRREILSRLGVVIASLGLGAAIAAVVLVPSAFLVPGSSGLDRRSGGGPVFLLRGLRTLLFPDWWGRPSGVELRGGSNYNERTIYVGVVSLVLALSTAMRTTRWRAKLPFAVLALVALDAARRLPPLNAVFTHVVPVANERLVLVIQLSLAVLGAFGLQELIEAGPDRRTWAALGGGVLAVAAAVAMIGPSRGQLVAAVDRVFGAGSTGRLDILPLTAVIWFVIALAALAAVLLLRPRLGPRHAALAVIALALLDLGRFAHGLQPMGPPDRVLPAKPASIGFLQRRARRDRVVAVGPGYPLLADAVMLYGLRDVRGQDPPEPGDRYSRLLTLAGASPTGLYFRDLDPRTLKILDALNVRWIVQDPRVTPIPAPGLSVAYRGRDALVRRNARAAPPALAPTRIIRVAGASSAAASLLSATFDPRHDAVVEGASIRVVGAGGVVRVAHEDDTSVELRAAMPRRGLVVLSETLEPGWRVDVDGRPAQVIRVDSVLRGVMVPAGLHAVRWHYRVPGLRLGLAVTLAGLLAMAGWGAALVIRRRARRDRSARAAWP